MANQFHVLVASLKELTELAEELSAARTPDKLRQLENVLTDCKRVALRLQNGGFGNERVKNPR